MAFDDSEAQRIQRIVGAYVERHRPPEGIRPQLDLAFRLEGQSIELFEIRPVWQGQAGEKGEFPFAKATYVRSIDAWKVFWRQADQKWHAYAEMPQVDSVERFLDLVEHDRHGCFRG